MTERRPVLAQDFISAMGKKPFPPLLLFAPGKASFNKEDWEPQLAEEAVSKVTKALVDPSMMDLAYSAFYAEEVQPGQIVQEAQTMPFLTDRRVVLVRNAERYFQMSAAKGSPLVPLIEYLKNPNESTVLMLVAGKVDRRVTFYTVCKSAGEIIECPQLSEGELETWIRAKADELGKRIDRAAVRALMDRAGSRLSDVTNALKLVSEFVGTAEQIRAQDVTTACADVAEDSVWALTDAIARSEPDKALRTLRQLQDMGKSADELMGTINWLLENAYRSAPNTAGSVKSSYVGDKVRPLVKKFGVEKLKDALALCTSTHFLMRSTGVDKDLALELLVIKLSYRRHGATR